MESPSNVGFNVSVVQVRECPDSGPEFEAVLRLSKLAKSTVGFMPDSAFRERAQTGTLLIAILDDVLVGYVLYDLPRDEVRIRQLVTDTAHRGEGTARLLVEELVGRHPSRRGIFLDCRRDFPVSAIWPKLHFAPVNERRGRSAEGLPLTVWFRDFGQPTLFSAATGDSDRPIAVVDTNVVIDLANGFETTSRALGAEWLQNAVQLAITEQVLLEIDQQEDSQKRKESRNSALSRFSQLQATPEIWMPLFDEMRSCLGTVARYDSDLKHAARAAAGGARWLVTRDSAFQSACSDIVRTVANLDLVTPGELLIGVDAFVRHDSYRPVDFAGSSLELRRLVAGEIDALSRAFVNQREGEKVSRLREALESLAAKAPTQVIEVLTDGTDYLGLLAHSGGATTSIQLCRVSARKGQSTIARQLLAIARRDAALGGPAGIQLVDPLCGEAVRRATADEGFVPADVGFTAVAVPGMGSRSELFAHVEAVATAFPSGSFPAELTRIAATESAVMLAEHLFYPWRLTGTAVPVFVVSIEPIWAGELFDVDIARSSLFPRKHGLALQREHVYYRSPSASGGISAPARVLWYVKAGPSNQPGIRAVSSLRDVTVGSPSHLFRRFAHLGVWDQNQVTDVSDGSRVMALSFSHTEMLPQVISLTQYRQLMQTQGVGITLQGPQRIPEQVFDQIASMSA
jgi:rRNA-processing protein FCF1/GNAT superfamily N-acetyltransferase